MRYQEQYKSNTHELEISKIIELLKDMKFVIMSNL